ncbi:autotransporter [Pseudomonas sp. Seg1]|uniref:autotransporter family protein n=1 Tax=Pseudomonas sp. Seg1 TaxID=2678259 RepID=UPI001BB3310B|nr:autotransporter outer membrane beta-barrel domain-containing protein [Pseudomonas sp. Seg1]BBP68691.1 autotransporter [Pseudomonas sp. Seg1]
MNTSCLRRSLLALSVAAATFNAPTALAATLNYDLSGGPLVSVRKTYDFLNLVGSINVVETSPSAMTSAAQFSGSRVNVEMTNKAAIAIDGATHGVGIDIKSAGISWVGLGSNLIHEGSITVNGLADSGDSTGIALKDMPITRHLLNRGTITVTGNNATGISLIGTTIGDGVNNDLGGNIIVSGNNARGIYMENTRQSASIYNVKTIKATGNGAEGLSLNGAAFVPRASDSTDSIFNMGTISGESIGIHVSNQPAAQGSFNITLGGGLVEGRTAAIQVDDGRSYLYWWGGDIKGNLLGLSGMAVDGEVDFDGSLIKSGYVAIQKATLNLVQPHTTIIGNLDMEDAESNIAMSVGNDTDINRPILTVSGTTDIAPGGHLQLQARSSDFRTAAAGNRYTLISSGNLVGGENLAVESTSALLYVKSYGVEGNDIKALVSTKSQEVVTENTLDAGGSHNAATAAGHLTSLMSRIDEQDPVFQTFANASTDAQLARLSESLSPDVSRGVLHAATNSQTLVSGVINERSSRARNAIGSPEKGVWLQALSSDANQDERRGVSGYDADSHGIAVGADGQLNADTTLGLAYSYLDTDVKSDLGSKTKVTGHALTVYGNWVHDNWFVDTSLMYGWNDNESKRYIAGTRAKGDYDSDVFGVSALAGYSLRLMPDVVLEPQVGARYANVGMDAYREKGSAASLNVGSQRYEVGELGMGARLAAAFAVGAGSLEPEAKLMAWHDVIGDKVATQSSFVQGGDSFTSRGTTPVRDSYELGLGANYRMGAWSVGGAYNYVTASGFDSDGFTAKVRYAF